MQVVVKQRVGVCFRVLVESSFERDGLAEQLLRLRVHLVLQEGGAREVQRVEAKVKVSVRAVELRLFHL